MRRFSRAVAAAVVVLGAATVAGAAPIIEVEFNSSIAGAQVIPASAFTLPVPGTVFNPPGYATATVSGLGGGDSNDVDFFAFTATGGNVYFDIDNTPFTFDTVLALFNSAGTVLAAADDSFPEDPGTEFGFDAFLGVFTLPGPGTYYIAVSQFSNFPNGLNSATVFANLFRPDGANGGVSVGDAAPGDSSYNSDPVSGNGTVPYTLHISVQNPAGQAVPEPFTMLLFGAGLTATAVRMRRRR